MLTLEAKIYFYTKQENSDALDNDLDTNNIIRPAINFGEGLLFSGTIKVNDKVVCIKRGEFYDAMIEFPTIKEEAFEVIRNYLIDKAIFNIQIASKVIGKCEMIDHRYNSK